MGLMKTDVLVVGAGPCGLTAATLLASYGVNAITITRYPATAHTPRAHITNIRTVEIFRDMGIEGEVSAASHPLSFLSNNVMVETLSGTEIARYKSYGSGSDRLSDYALASPCQPVNMPQHIMEPVLLQAARQRGADIRFSQELVQIEQTPDKVRAHVRNRATDEFDIIEAEYVIGADGGRSTVAEQLKVRFEGEAGLRSMVNVWVDADLTKYTAYRPGVLYSVHQVGKHGWTSAGAWICVNPWTDWVFSTPGTAEVPESELVAKAKRTIGDPEVAIHVKNISGWEVNHLFAATYRIGRVFLAGDAAHRHPPSGGLGTNTSVQDAYNLAWKLAFVLKGKAGDALLDTYHDERQPIGKFVVERAMKSLYSMDTVATALGSAGGDTKNAAPPSLADLFADTPNAAERRRTLASAVAAQNYRSNALGVELGQRYQSSAVIDDDTAYPAFERDRELYYQPTTHPGACLPHAWIEHNRKMISTLDAVGGGHFTLIYGIGGSDWASAAAAMGAEFDIDVRLCAIGYRCEYDDVLGEWTGIREIDDDGALLVRPDRHVAWRSAAAPRNGHARILRNALSAILARN